MKRYIYLVGSVFSCLIAPAIAQATDQNEDKIDLFEEIENSEVFDFSFGAPTSPAMALAGLTSADVTQINQLNDILISGRGILDGDLTGSVEINPGTLLNPTKDFRSTYDRYENSPESKVLDRIQLSVLFRKGEENLVDPEKSRKSLISFGGSASLLNNSNPLFNAYEKVEACQSYIDQANDILKDSDFGLFENSNHSEISEIKSDLRPEFYDPSELDSFKSKFLEIVKAVDSPVEYQAILLQVNDMDVAEFRTQVNSYHKSFTDKLEAQYLTEKKSILLPFYKGCKVGIERELFSRPNLDVGAAILLRGDEEQFQNFESGGKAIWLSYRYPIVTNPKNDWFVAIGGTGRFAFSEQVSTGDEGLPNGTADNFQLWGGVEFYQKNWRLSGRMGYAKTEFEEDSFDQFSRQGEKWLVSGDLKLREDLWLGISYGEASSSSEILEGEVLKISLKFSEPTSINIFD